MAMTSGRGVQAESGLRGTVQARVARTGAEMRHIGGGETLAHHRASRANVGKVQCDLLVLWDERGVVHRLFDPLAL